MKKTLAALTALVLVATVGVPAAFADHQATTESQTRSYLTSSGAWSEPNQDLGLPPGNAVVICPDALAGPLDPEYDPVNGDPLGFDTGNPSRGCPNRDPIIPHMGSATFFTEHGEFSSFSATPEDDIFGSNAPIAPCLWNPEQSANFCSHADHEAGTFGCGTQDVEHAQDADGNTFTTYRATVFVFTLFVADDLNVCGGTSGAVQGDFSQV